MAGSRGFDDLTDEGCLVALGRGDRGGLVEILRRYQERVVNLIHQMVGDWDAALDLGQEVFLRIHRRVETFDPARTARSWILTIAANLARDYLRRRRRVLYFDELDSPVDSRQPGESLEREELRRTVRRALGELSETQRALIVLRDFEGLGYEELAEVMQCERGTVKSRLHRARRQFEEIFRRLDSPPPEVESRAR